MNAIGFAVMALVALYNYYDGFHEQVIRNVIRYKSGHLVVSSPGFQNRYAANLFIKNPQAVEEWLTDREEVRSYSHRVIAQGLVSTANGSSNVALVGIDPDKEKRVTRFAGNMIQGEFLGKSKKPIILGKELAKILKAQLGTKVVVLTQGIDGSIGNELFHVVGIFETQSDFDKSMAFMPIADARALLSLPKRAVHETAIVLKSGTNVIQTQKDFINDFGSHSKSKMEMLNWMQVQKPLMAMIELNKGANRLLMFIILFVAALGVANSILMSILERTREFGVMLAIGTSKGDVMRMVVVETLLLSAIGVMLGNVFGVLLTLYFHQHGFDLAWLTSQKLVVQGTIIQTVSYPTVQWVNSLFVSGTILALSFIVSIIPIKHVANLSPVRALRSL
jgi:ABC-type lipoprotein release transport system permease subunit